MNGSEADLDCGVATADRTGRVHAFDAIGARYEQTFPNREGRVTAGARQASGPHCGSRALDGARPTGRRSTGAGRHADVDLSTVTPRPAGNSTRASGLTHRDLGIPTPGEQRGLALRGGATPLRGGATRTPAALKPSRGGTRRALHRLRRTPRPHGLFTLAKAEAALADTEISFLGHIIRVSGFLRDELRQVVHDAGFEIAGEGARVQPGEYRRSTRAPAVPQLPTHQIHA
ncbi:SAM-dependent methyltransferase [Streptomyces sp. TS71-3]|uniref:SAM-dependent methyltransferase n=1 Tax=Streptomyces sp. TS71-3 TaxID=2733862 RepID=UPI001B10FAD4|nr:SAM-dependent methyltransferase [Streptomyces sp. TS71-3]GHJ35381.1 methyltransferase [Streptomyces sp. TS71-3]